MTSGASGISKALPAFMRSADSDQTPCSRSNSPQVARRTICERAPVMISKRAATESRALLLCAKRSMSIGTSFQCIAGKFCRLRAFFFSALLSKLSRCPRHRAGFSPSLKPRAFAASSTCSICPRTSSAVRVLLAQMGCKTLRTCSV
ncbi:hypothetical protein D9M70_584940 [compost metagenome]